MLFGGESGSSETWIWDGSSWTQGPAAGPPARAWASSATLGSKVVLFGGQAPLYDGGNPYGNVYDDTWVWDGASWSQRDVPGPFRRADAAMATLGNKLVLFGGRDEVFDALGDTWTWDGSVWSQVASTGPTPRWGAVAAAFGDGVVLYGGTANLPYSYQEDTWFWDGSTWTQVSGTGPGARTSAAAATVGGRLVVFGGQGPLATPGPGLPLSLLDDTWAWDGSWTEILGVQPSPRTDPSMTSLGCTALLFGGSRYFSGTTGGELNDTWEFDGAAWTQRNVAGPPPQSGATMSAY